MWLVDLNFNFACVWLIELSDNKLFHNKLSRNKLFDKLAITSFLLVTFTFDLRVIM